MDRIRWGPFFWIPRVILKAYDPCHNNLKLAEMAAKRQQTGSYNKPLRTQAIQQIRRLLVVEGYTYDEIMQQLGLSKQLFYRYLLAVFHTIDNCLLKKYLLMKC